MDRYPSELLRKLEKEFPAGATLFQRGDQSREMYILLAGEVEVLIDTIRTAVITEPGSYLGEMSTLLNEPRTATVRTIGASRFIVVGPDQVEQFLGYSPRLARKLATILAKRLKNSTDDLYKARKALERCEARCRELQQET
jgi:CRP-like cAMP-binding protein